MIHQKSECKGLPEDRAMRFADQPIRPCPFLPPMRSGLDYRHLRIHPWWCGNGDRVFAALEYAHVPLDGCNAPPPPPPRAVRSLPSREPSTPPRRTAKTRFIPCLTPLLSWICQTHGGQGAGFLREPPDQLSTPGPTYAPGTGRPTTCPRVGRVVSRRASSPPVYPMMP